MKRISFVLLISIFSHIYAQDIYDDEHRGIMYDLYTDLNKIDFSKDPIMAYRTRDLFLQVEKLYTLNQDALINVDHGCFLITLQ